MSGHNVTIEPSATPIVHTSAASQAFAEGFAEMLERLGSAARGAGLASLVEHLQLLLSEGNVRIELDDVDVVINGQAASRSSVNALRLAMQTHELRALHLRFTTTARDLVHFAALLAGPIAANSVGFARLWTLHGSWHIVVDAAEGPEDSMESDGTVGSADVVERVARLIGEGASVLPSSASFQRLIDAGDRAAEVLFAFMVRAGTGAERRRYFDAIVRLESGSAYLFAALSHPTWFVVRNAVALLGVKQVDGAADALARVMAHPDRRVRAAVAEAMARLPDDSATLGLHVAITDHCAEVRLAAWSAFTSPKRVPKPTLMNEALQHEPDHAVLRAVIAAVKVHIDLPSPGALVRCIAHLLSRGDQMPLACEALEALAIRQPRSTIPLLRRIIDDGDSEIRLRAQLIQQRVQLTPPTAPVLPSLFLAV